MNILNRKTKAVALLIGISLIAGLVPVSANQVDLNVGMTHPFMLADKKQTTYLKVGMTGFEIENKEDRTPVNVALVLDKSGSMGGDKIRHAREAAKLAVSRLSDKDIISLITYDDTISVLLPATKVSDKELIYERINQISADGSTALFAGVSKGASEIRKFLDDQRVNRVILLSDGQANKGPSTPGELGNLGASLIKEGISVSTIGLGLNYNEDLMYALASKSDGNHVFVEAPEQLASIFDQEFGSVLSVVAQDVSVKIECAEGIRPIRVIGREAEISGQSVFVSMNQLYTNHEKYVILEVEVPARPMNAVAKIANVTLTYANMETQVNDRVTSEASVRFTNSGNTVETNINRDAMVAATLQIATEQNQKATLLRDQGNIEEARALFFSNSGFIRENNTLLDSDILRFYETSNGKAANNLEGSAWTEQKKINRDEQFMGANQALTEEEMRSKLSDRY